MLAGFERVLALVDVASNKRFLFGLRLLQDLCDGLIDLLVLQSHWQVFMPSRMDPHQWHHQEFKDVNMSFVL